jgi:hypothetical protein
MLSEMGSHRLCYRFAALVLLGLAWTAASASSTPVRPLSATPESAGTDSPSLTIDVAEYERMWRLGSVLVQGFPLADGATVDLELVAFDVAPRARFVAGGAEGDQPFDPPPMRFFRGRVLGEADSSAYLWMGLERIGGFVRSGVQGPATWIFGPAAARSDRPESMEHIVLRADGWRPEGAPPFCANQTPESSRQQPRLGARGASDALLKFEIALDATVDFFREFHDLDDATSYVLSLIGAVSTIYEQEVNTLIEVVFLRIFTTPSNPYGAPGNPVELLDSLITEWTTNPAVMNVPRDVAHVLHFTGGTGGLANIDSLCDTDLGYAASYVFASYTYPDPAYTYDAYVVSHELGHNAGTNHTHCYEPPIDICGAETNCYEGPTVQTPGTIMSYCDEVELVFHPRVFDVVRPVLESAACVSAAGDPGAIGVGGSPGLELGKTKVTYELKNDDGVSDGSQGIAGTVQQAWVKRFTPPCYPFVLTRIDTLFEGLNVEVGRPIELLVYTDPAASGDVAGSTLTYTEPRQIELISLEEWNEYTLATPVELETGDYYVGFFDLLADPATNSLARWDLNPPADDSYVAYDTTDPSGYTLDNNRSWMTRAHGHCGEPTLRLSWDEPCNEASVPGQDFGVYQGTLGPPFDSHASLTCTTGSDRSWTLPGIPLNDRYFIVVPSGPDAEGAYGSVPVAAEPCRPSQEIGRCD